MSERGAVRMSPRSHREGTGRIIRRLRALRRYGNGAALVNGITTLCVMIAAAMIAAAAVPAAAQGPARILAFGDSLTAGFGVGPDEAFSARLQARLAAEGIPAQVTNGGVSGDTTSGGLARLDWALADHPDLVLVELGANDALRGIDPKFTYANLDAILARLKAAHTKILLIGMIAPGNWGRDYHDDFDAIFPALAKKYEVPLYPFFLDGVALDPTLNQRDGLHPNAKGVDVIVARIAPYVTRLLQDKGTDG